jgi:uncharacterized membrane protein
MPTILSSAHASPPVPTGPGFDIVLLLHVAAVVIGLAAVVASGVQAGRLRKLVPTDSEDGVAAVPENLRRFFSPGMNWAGRSIYAVPILGFVLLGLSHHAFSFSDSWVQFGIGLWVIAALDAEIRMWPAEQRIQKQLLGDPDTGATTDWTAVRRECRVVSMSAMLVVVLFVAAIVLMFAQP